jgi:hypothetical protein
MRTCPKCSLLSPDAGVMCDCGHSFDPAGAEMAISAVFRPRDETHPAGPSKGAKFGAGLLGLVVGGLPPAVMAEYQAALGQGENVLLRVLSYVMGVVGIAVALQLLKKKHESPPRAKDRTG